MTQDDAIQSAVNHSMTLCLALLAAEGPAPDVIDIRRKELKADLRKQLIQAIELDIQRLQRGNDIDRRLAKVLIDNCDILNIEVNV